VQNALAAIAVATELGVPGAVIRKALAEFRGVGRRFQRYGEIPLPRTANRRAVSPWWTTTDITRSRCSDARRGARRFPGRRIVLAFQPHRYTRTRDLFEDFVKTLSGVDALLLAEVYPAGETPIVAADGRSLARAIRVAGKDRARIRRENRRHARCHRKIVRPGDVVLTMGAGSIGGVPAALARTGR